MTSSSKLSLQVDQLRFSQKASDLGFTSTKDIESFVGILGQERAVRALCFGLGMKRRGYGLYVMGRMGTGKTSYIKQHLNEQAKQEKPADDWVYVNNFENLREPLAIALPSGLATKWQKDMDHFVDQLLLTFPSAFESPTYQQEKSTIEHNFNSLYDEAINQVERSAVRLQLALYRDNGSFSFAPISEGKALDEAAFALLDETQRTQINADIQTIEAELNEALLELPQWKRESSEALQKLNKKTIGYGLKPLLAPLRERYSKQKAVLTYLSVMEDSLHNFILELLADERGIEYREDPSKKQKLINFCVPNILVCNQKKKAAPVIFEAHPSYRNLFGSVEYANEMGSLITSYRYIRAGSLHKANGGYLIVEAEKLLTEPFVWQALKRAQKQGQIEIEPVHSDLMATVSLSPEVIPLKVKVILIGSDEIYYRLQEVDPEFQKLFRVLVDFENYLDRTEQNTYQFARLLKSRAEDEGYAPLTAEAVAALIEQSARLAEHQNKLSTRIGDLFELLAEADYMSRIAKDNELDRKHVDQALRAKNERNGQISREVQKHMLDGIIFIETQGDAVGRINGLTVLDVGDNSFGQPARITATVYPGSQGIVDIEKEVSLGHAIHSKGVMILSGYLGSKYAQEFPLAICANLAMEQSYGHIDGDSAALAELCCLISALTSIPLTQSIAITGSLNQHGEVQPVGGVNEKIEGFFKLCHARGLTGGQGVVIPFANICNLMLDKKVIDAVQAGNFAIYAVKNVDQTLEILTGRPAGKLISRGLYPVDSINHKVVERLRQIGCNSEGTGSRFSRQ